MARWAGRHLGLREIFARDNMPAKPAMKTPRSSFLVFVAMFSTGRMLAADAPLLTETPTAADFMLASGGHATPVLIETQDDKAIVRAAGDFVADVERVTGVKPVTLADAGQLNGEVVLVGALGHSPLIDRLAAAGKLDTTGIADAWESYVIQTVADPAPGVRRALVIAGSDRRGTIYGMYAVSEAIGVSPWYWWADVPVRKHATLALTAGAHRQGPPSVKYRGIFLNDEDWGLQPWAAKTFEPERGNLGPKTYARICELLLRLRANTLWPAMHEVSTAFNALPENRVVADSYGIVMGSSHCEPLLRNNVGEWPKDNPTAFNFLTNAAGVTQYWEQRVQENAAYENIYTIGMRGIHDGAMQGPKTPAEHVATLEKIFPVQRALIAKYVNPDPAKVPQIFCPYKEVLNYYLGGLKIPSDVTLVFPDDNFGYIRYFPSAAEVAARPGGFGVYYHISYLGAPMSYLWLETTPPALIWEEMSKAYDHGMRNLWIVNVGDLKPGEIGTEFFLQMAYDINRWQADNLSGYLTERAARDFGPEHAREIGDVLAQYYQLNFQRKPEHLQWWLPGKAAQPSPFTPAERTARLDAFARLAAASDRLAAALPPETRDAFFELVNYPVTGAALANQRFFYGEMAAAGGAEATAFATRASAADAKLKSETQIYNEQTAGGKWRHLMNLEPADQQWGSMRIAEWKLPPATRAPAASGVPAAAEAAGLGPTAAPGPLSFVENHGLVAMAAGDFSRSVAQPGAKWVAVPGLGRTGRAALVEPTNAPEIAPARLAADAPRLEYTVQFTAAGRLTLTVNLLPTHSLVLARGLRFAVGIDDQPPLVVTANIKDTSADWAQSVLNETALATAPIEVPSAGAHTLSIYMVDAGVVLDKLTLSDGALPPGYLGAAETTSGQPSDVSSQTSEGLTAELP